MTNWTWGIYLTQTGEFRGTVQVSDCSWASMLTGQGRGSHTFPLTNNGRDSDWWQESSKGNKFTLVQRWGDYVAYAGVLGVPEYDRDTRTLKIDSVELRAAYMDARMLFGVFSYTPGDDALSVASKSLSGAAHDVLERSTTSYWGSFWELPIDLPSDGSGSFSADWGMDERLTLEDHLSQIEAAGCEVFFRPYLDDDNYLRWQTIVESKVTVGPSVAEVDLDAPDCPVHGLKVRKDYTRQLTGILGFGKGGTDAAGYGYSPGDGAAEVSVRDTWVSFPDLTGDRLEGAVEALDYLNYPIEQWSFGASVWPDGPGWTAPGRQIDFTVAGDEFIPDGTYEKRVVSVRGDAGTHVRVEVQDAA